MTIPINRIASHITIKLRCKGLSFIKQKLFH